MRFVDEHPQHPVDLVLRVLGIASSTFYGWLKQAKQPSARRLADEQLVAEIVDVHTSSGGVYGAPRVHAMLRRRGIAVGRRRVERLMRGAGLQGAFLREGESGLVAQSLSRRLRSCTRWSPAFPQVVLRIVKVPWPAAHERSSVVHPLLPRALATHSAPR